MNDYYYSELVLLTGNYNTYIQLLAWYMNSIAYVLVHSKSAGASSRAWNWSGHLGTGTRTGLFL